MFRSLRWLLAVPLVFAAASDTLAGIHCGGCSDPCAARGGYFGGPFARIRAMRMNRNSGVWCAPTVSGYGYAAPSYNGGWNGPGYAMQGQAFYGQPMQAGSVYGGSGYSSGVAYGGCTPAGQMAYGTIATQSTMAAPANYQGANYQGAIGASNVATGGAISNTITSYQTVMKPTYVTETQYVAYTEYQNETRYRVRKTYRTVPVQEVNYRTKLVMRPTTETKTIEYSVVIPEKSEKQVEVTHSVPQWNDVNEEYKVRVPYLVDVEEAYTVKLATLRDQPFEYTVQVPQVETRTVMQTVTNSVPVTKKRTVQRMVPRTTMQTVNKDYGHWETVVEEIPYAAPAMNMGSASGAPMQAASVTVVMQGQSGQSMGGCGQASNIVTMGGCGNGGSYYSVSPCQNSCQGNRGRAGRRARCGCGACASQSYGYAGANYASGMNQGCGISGGYGVAQATIVMSAPMAEAVQSVPMTRTQSRRVWVPNVVAEEVPVTQNESVSEEVAYTVYEQHSEQVPVEASSVVYRPEVRQGTKKVVEYANETRTRTRKQVEYREESRTRTRKELTYRQETKMETYPVVNYRTEKRTKDVTFTVNVPEYQAEEYTTIRYDQVAEDVVEEYTVRVPVPSYREIQVQVCKLVPDLVPVTINIAAPATFQSMPVADGVSYGQNYSSSYASNDMGNVSYGSAVYYGSGYDQGSGYSGYSYGSNYGQGYGACLPYSYGNQGGYYGDPWMGSYGGHYRTPFLLRRRCR